MLTIPPKNHQGPLNTGVPLVCNRNNYFRGPLTDLGIDSRFEHLTSGQVYPIAEITDADPAVVTFAGEGIELVATSDDRDFTTWGNVNWAGYSGGTVADGTGKLICTMDASGDSGTYLPSNNINITDGNEQWFEILLDVWQGTTSKTDFNVSFGDPTNYKTITVSGVQDTYIVRIQSNVDEPHLRIVAPNSDSGTFFVDNASVQKLHDYEEGDCITIGGVPDSEGISPELVTDWDMEDDPENNYTNSSTILANEAVTVYAGSQSLKGTLTADYGSFYQNISVTAEDWMIVSGYVTNDAGDQSQLRVTDVSNGVALYFTNMQDNNGSWDELSYVFQVPVGCSTIRLVARGRYVSDVIYADNISAKKIFPVQATPYRITAIDSEGACTLGNLDLSGMAAAITSAYASKTTFKHYVAGTGYKPYTVPDYTPVNSNSEFDQWTYTSKTSGSTVAGLMYRIDAQSIVDFTTVGSADNVIGTEFLCTGVVALSAVDAVSEITPTEYTVSGLSATNYLVYDTSANTIRFVSDGNSLTLRSTAIANETFFYDVSITDMTDVGIYISAYGESIAKVFDTKNTYLGFLTTGDDERIQLVRSTDCDVTVSYWRLYKVTDTGAEVDGAQTGPTDLISLQAEILLKKGYNIKTTIDTISSGSITPVVTTTEGVEIFNSGEDEQDIRSNGTGPLALRASATAEGIIVSNLSISGYKLPQNILDADLLSDETTTLFTDDLILGG